MPVWEVWLWVHAMQRYLHHQGVVPIELDVGYLRANGGS